MVSLPISIRTSVSSTEPSPQTLTSSNESVTEASPPMFIVKNTFINVAEDEETPFAQRGVQTCTARLSSPSVDYAMGPPVTLPGINPNSGSYLACPEEGVAATSSSLTPGQQSHVSEESNGSLGYTVKNTFIEVDDGSVTPVARDRTASSCTARLNGSERPLGFSPDERLEAHPESPAASPAPTPVNAVDDAQMLPRSVPMPAGLDDLSSPASQGGGSGYSASGVHMPFVVRNTFIEVKGDDEENAFNHGSKTCTGRFTGPTPALFPPTPLGGATGRSPPPGISLDDSKQFAPVAEGDSEQPPSAGSALHGTLGSDDQPACQPCAWFFKESGCLNGLQCRYCHLCPQGELKNRKKLKIARLRGADAAAAEAAAEANAEVPVASADAPFGAAPVAAASRTRKQQKSLNEQQQQQQQRG